MKYEKCNLALTPFVLSNWVIVIDRMIIVVFM